MIEGALGACVAFLFGDELGDLEVAMLGFLALLEALGHPLAHCLGE
jgi:hypothetical protein